MYDRRAAGFMWFIVFCGPDMKNGCTLYSSLRFASRARWWNTPSMSGSPNSSLRRCGVSKARILPSTIMETLLQYSASFGNMAKNKNLLMLTGGNVWKKGPVTAYLDFMYSREGLDTKGQVSQLSDLTVSDENAVQWTPVSAQNVEYFTTIANLDYRVHKNWNVFIKGAFETAGVYESNGTKANGEVLFSKGLYKRTWNGQLCAECIPMPERDNLRFYAHLLYKKYNYTEQGRKLGAVNNDMQRITLGLVYTIPVF